MFGKPPILNYEIGKETKNHDFVLSADWHYVPFAENAVLKKMLDDAKRAGKHVFGFGDMFDLIFPTDRKRSSSRTREQSQTDGPINDIMTAAEDFFAPYADVIDFMSYGNHETSAMKWNNFDPIQDLHSRLMRYRTRPQPILRGRYAGFLLIRFPYVTEGKEGTVQSITIYYDHGRGGAPEVSKGTISLERMYTEFVADIYVTGHIHKMLIDATRTTTYLDKNRNIKQKPKYGVVVAALTDSEVDIRQPEDIRRSLVRDFEEEAGWTSQARGYVALSCDFRHRSALMEYDLRTVRS